MHEAGDGDLLFKPTVQVLSIRPITQNAPKKDAAQRTGFRYVLRGIKNETL